MLSMMAVTNKDYCMVNTLIATMPDGEEYVFDSATHIKSFCGLTKREFMAL